MVGLGDLKRAWSLKRAYDRIKEASMKGTLKTTLFALLGALATSAVAAVTGACPGLTTQGVAIATAALGGGVAFLSRRPASAPGGKSILVGAAAAAGAAFVDQVAAVCGADFVSKLPTIAVGGFWVGLGLYLKSPKQAAEAK